MKKYMVFFLFLLFTIFPKSYVLAVDLIPAVGQDTFLLSDDDRQRLFRNTSLYGVGIVTVWGVLQWDYFSRSPHAQSEGWFGADTDTGGADKLGHMYSSYAFSHGLSKFYEYKGFRVKDAALYGALSSFSILGCMELGDAFSNYGFSWEDMTANGLGTLLAYFLYKNKELAEKIDFRWQYDLRPNKSDFTTDYENSKYLLALKLNGFETLRNTPWRHIEFHLGYYTRGFDDNEADEERNIYLGIGLNLTDVLDRHAWKKTATLLRYIQLPYTSINLEHDFE